MGTRAIVHVWRQRTPESWSPLSTVEVLRIKLSLSGLVALTFLSHFYSPAHVIVQNPSQSIRLSIHPFTHSQISIP